MSKGRLDRRVEAIEAVEERRIAADVHRFAMGVARVRRGLTLAELLTLTELETAQRDPATAEEHGIAEKAQRLEQEHGVATLGPQLERALGKSELDRRRVEEWKAAMERIERGEWRPGDEVITGPEPTDSLYQKLSDADLDRLCDSPDGAFLPLLRELAIAYGELPALAA